MKIIPLRSVPNQKLSFTNGEDFWELEIKVAINTMICNIWRNGELIIQGSRIVSGVPMIPYRQLAGHGNFAIMTENEDEPNWRNFETNQRLVFIP